MVLAYIHIRSYVIHVCGFETVWGVEPAEFAAKSELEH